MPYCPNCHDEFQDWVTTCPDCKVKLVDSLPEEPGSDYDYQPDEPVISLSKEPIVTVALAPNQIIAKMWAEILDQNNIKSIISAKTTAFEDFYRTYTRNWIGLTSISVLESNAEKAKKILAPFIESLDKTDIEKY